MRISTKSLKLSIFLMIVIFVFTSCSKTPVVKVAIKKIPVTISVVYDKPFYIGDENQYNVCIDDNKIAKHSPGITKKYDIELQEGVHTFSVKNDGIYTSQKMEFIVSDKQTSFNFGFKVRASFGIEVWES